MVRGSGWFGIAVGFALFGCQRSEPTHKDLSELYIPIVGGQRDTTSHAVVGILSFDSLCSGSLLAPNLVLTARHCVADTGGEEIDCATNMFGPTDDASTFTVTTDSDISTGNVSPAYGVSEVRTPSSSRVCGNDIAVMILSQNIPASTATPLIPRLENRPMADETFDAIGYGIQNPTDELGTTAGVRMRADDNAIYCVGSSACSGSATNSEWLALAPICSGDSGGPALDSTGRVIGVASRGNADCSAALYEAVDSWKDMIVEAAQDAADQGGYEPPAWAEEPATNGGTSGAGKGGGGSGGAPAAGSGGSRMNSGGTMDSGADAGEGAVAGGGSSNAGSSGASGASGRGGSSTSGGSGGSLAGAGANSGGRAGAPVNNPLGDPCTQFCTHGYLCYTPDEKPPGICVPGCSSNEPECPTGYTCDVESAACTPDDDDDGDSKLRRNTDEGCGCRTAPTQAGTDSAWGILALAGILAGRLRRRRRATRE